MKIDSRFQARPKGNISLSIDGEIVFAHQGDSVANALLAYSGDATRETENGSPRTPFCMMGVCFDCLVEIDGSPNEQSCMVQVREGMVVKRHKGLRKFNNGISDNSDV